MLRRFASDFAADVRHAARQLHRRAGFAAAVVVTLGLGIGATVALLSVVNDLLLRPLPYAHEDRVRVFWMDYDWRGEEYDFVRERPGVFQSIAAFSTNGSPYHPSTRAEGNAALLPFVVATSQLFDVLGSRPYLGRTLQPADDQPGGAQVIVISYGMWMQDLGGDPHVIGHEILLDGKPVTVVGVMRDSVTYDLLNRVVAATNGLNQTTTYAYGDNVFLTSVTDPKNQVYSFVHNALGWVTRRTGQGPRTHCSRRTTPTAT